MDETTENLSDVVMPGPFTNVFPNPLQRQSMDELRDAYSDLYRTLLNYVPNSREKSLAITKLEESAMWANKAITHGGQ